ncbi:MAG: SAM-dependent methyltransferase [Rhodospirillaceae bacterium]|nr:SAM-dependent methyltransferase [Rhodospirillaceae bacterium]
MQTISALAFKLAERGYLPDKVVRLGIRQLLKERLISIDCTDCESVMSDQQHFIEMMNSSEIAPVPHLANEQHYEMPAEFFKLILGSHLKYSCGYWPKSTMNLEESELAALEVTGERAQLKNGQTILDLGCGWGSFSLWAAENFSDSLITAVSNSNVQRAVIESEIKQRNLTNVTVLTRDMNEFNPFSKFDRIISIEMFEHMRNYRLFFSRISDWLNTDGRFFMHIFCHRSSAYEFIDHGPTDWMTRHFFSGGIMPSDDLPLRFQEDLILCGKWRWAGTHYEKTSNAWLHNMDLKKNKIMKIMYAVYGQDKAKIWWARWRIFFMACAELFGFEKGQQWWVSHYLYRHAE